MYRYRNNQLKNNKRYIILFFAFVLIMSLAIGGACANDEPEASPDPAPAAPAEPEDTAPAAAPEPAAPEPAPVPGRVMPASWSDSQIFTFEPGLVLDVSADWRGEVDGEAFVYYFNEDSDLPRLSLYKDTVYGMDDFDEFFDWWLAERFYNPEYNSGADVIRQDENTFNGIRGLEIDYMESFDDTLRIAFYIFYERMYYQVRFAFEPDGDGPYRDEIDYVFNSIRKINAELDEWPTAYLPANTPVYTDGNVIEGYAYTSDSYSDITVRIGNTSTDALSKFSDQMEKLGWTIDYFDNNSGNGGGSYGSWFVHMYMEDDGTTAAINFNLILE